MVNVHVCVQVCMLVYVGQIMTFGVKLYHFLPYSFDSLSLNFELS